MSQTLIPILWFIAILAMIPLALWLLKRTPMGGANASGQMRVIAALPMSTSQRLITVEVGQGEDRRWLVLGVTAQSISTLHVMPPQAMAEAPQAATPFAQVLGRFGKGAGDAS